MSNVLKSSDFAFPMSTVDGYSQDGMTMRDYFAGQALGAVVKSCATDSYQRATYPTIEDYFASKAYGIADAMMRAREA